MWDYGDSESEFDGVWIKTPIADVIEVAVGELWSIVFMHIAKRCIFGENYDFYRLYRLYRLQRMYIF